MAQFVYSAVRRDWPGHLRRDCVGCLVPDAYLLGKRYESVRSGEQVSGLHRRRSEAEEKLLPCKGGSRTALQKLQQRFTNRLCSLFLTQQAAIP